MGTDQTPVHFAMGLETSSCETPTCASRIKTLGSTALAGHFNQSVRDHFLAHREMSESGRFFVCGYRD
jgi:hypothetical protein